MRPPLLTLLAPAVLTLLLYSPGWANYAAGLDAQKRGDYATAAKEFRHSAKQGYSPSQFALGSMYAAGQGVPRDAAEAARWYRRAAEQGILLAQTNLGVMYAKGDGVLQDYKAAVHWYRRAAEQDFSLGQWFLGQMYERGHGVPQDYVQAYMWYSIGAAGGFEVTRNWRDALAKRMTPTQTAEAQRLAREWKPRPSQ